MARKRTTRNVSLSPKLDKFVERLVSSGDYQTASEVFRESLRLMQERMEQLADIRAKIAEGRADIAAGRTHTVESVMGAWQRRNAARARRVPRNRKSA